MDNSQVINKISEHLGRDEKGVFFDYFFTITFGELTIEGSVGHDHYSRIFGKARELFAIRCIPGFVKDAGRIYFLFTRRAEYDFAKNLFFGDFVKTRVRIEKLGDSSFTIGGEFFNSADEICATARHVIVYVDRATGQKGMPEEFKRNLAGLMVKKN